MKICKHSVNNTIAAPKRCYNFYTKVTRNKNATKTKGKRMKAKEKIIRAILTNLSEAEKGLADCDNIGIKAYHRGRISAHHYDLLVIDRILSEEEKGREINERE